MTLKPEEMKKLEIELKLHINKKLFGKGHISEEMFEKAKARILSP